MEKVLAHKRWPTKHIYCGVGYGLDYWAIGTELSVLCASKSISFNLHIGPCWFEMEYSWWRYEKEVDGE